MNFFLLFFSLLLTSLPALAQEDAFTFGPPIDCHFGTDCWVLNYVDRTPDKDGKALDNACAARTYDGHKGTDFAIPNEKAMKKGVAVLAAADGKVLRMRNTEPDRFPTKEELEKTRADNKDCGNAVLIDHGHGWQTLYCHLKKDSVTVKIGDTVTAGKKIASVGLSGYTQFPHVHFGVIKDGKVMDPFSGTEASEDCSKTATPLWKADTNFKYEELVLFDTAFDTAPPTLEQLDKGRDVLTTLKADEAPALVYHALIGGVQAGDIAHLVIKSPDGSVFAERTITQDKPRARQMFFIGRKTDQIQLMPGTYKGSVVIKRNDKTWQKETIITVTK